MKLLLPKRALKLPVSLSEDKIAELINWVVFHGHQPTITCKLVIAALPDVINPEAYVTDETNNLAKIAYELLEDHHIMGSYLTMHSDNRYFVIERNTWKTNYLDEGFLRNLEKDDW